MTYAVIGSRTFNDYKLLKEWLDKIPNIDKLVSGGAKGADTLAEQYAGERKLEMDVYVPDWSIGKRAANIRNEDIVNAANKIVAFWDGESRGTQHALQYARKNKKPVLIIYYLTGQITVLN